MLYYAATTLETDGAVMVTGSHNPPDYNGFKMMLGNKPFFGAQISRRSAQQAARGDVVAEADGSERAVDLVADYVAPADLGLGRRRPGAGRGVGQRQRCRRRGAGAPGRRACRATITC